MSKVNANQISFDFTKGNIKLWIVLHRTSDGSGSIEFHHRMRFGQHILPIPVWLSYDEAFRQLTNWQEDFFDSNKCELVEVKYYRLKDR